jgi:hypothetical protein
MTLYSSQLISVVAVLTRTLGALLLYFLGELGGNILPLQPGCHPGYNIVISANHIQMSLCFFRVRHTRQ